MRPAATDVRCAVEVTPLRAEPRDDAEQVTQALRGEVDCSGLVHIVYRRLGRLVPRDASQQEQAGTPLTEEEAVAGDLVTYGEELADHIAFWLGEGRILHSIGRDDGLGVVAEPEPAELKTRRRRFFRMRI